MFKKLISDIKEEFNDLTQSTSSNQSTSQPTNQVSEGQLRSQGNEELLREISHLKRQLEEANKIRKDQKQQIFELQDDLRVKEQLQDNLSVANEHLMSDLSQTRSQLNNLLKNLHKVPPNHQALLENWKKNKDFIEQLRESVVCPMCYEYFKKEQWAALRCGHCFCLNCLEKYSSSHMEMWKKNPNVQGPYPGYDCPECRLPVFSTSSKDPSPFSTGAPGLKTGMWRIWILEEIVRHLDKQERREEKDNQDWEIQIDDMLKGELPDQPKQEGDPIQVDNPISDVDLDPSLNLAGRDRHPYSTSPPS